MNITPKVNNLMISPPNKQVYMHINNKNQSPKKGPWEMKTVVHSPPKKNTVFQNSFLEKLETEYK